MTLTGYPQLGRGELHIAHVLWGGLLLFVAALLPLILANRWVYTTEALLAGMGMGLFIDEVGKFITRNNDYFYPPAAPIIYAIFLLTVLLYLRVRRTTSEDTRTELYRSLDFIEEVLDRDLDREEHQELEALLKRVQQQADHPDWARLAGALLNFLSSEDLHLAAVAPSRLERSLNAWRRMAGRLFGHWRLKGALVGGLGALGLVQFLRLSRLIIALQSPAYLQELVADMVLKSHISSTVGLSWFSIRLALEGTTGFLLILSAVLLLIGYDRRGCHMAFIALLFSLAGINLLVFYFDQFATIFPAAVQFALLMGVIYYQRHYTNDTGQSLK